MKTNRVLEQFGIRPNLLQTDIAVGAGSAVALAPTFLADMPIMSLIIGSLIALAAPLNYARAHKRLILAAQAQRLYPYHDFYSKDAANRERNKWVSNHLGSSYTIWQVMPAVFGKEVVLPEMDYYSKPDVKKWRKDLNSQHKSNKVFNTIVTKGRKIQFVETSYLSPLGVWDKARKNALNMP